MASTTFVMYGFMLRRNIFDENKHSKDEYDSSDSDDSDEDVKDEDVKDINVDKKSNEIKTNDNIKTASDKFPNVKFKILDSCEDDYNLMIAIEVHKLYNNSVHKLNKVSKVSKKQFKLINKVKNEYKIQKTPIIFLYTK